MTSTLELPAMNAHRLAATATALATLCASAGCASRGSYEQLAPQVDGWDDVEESRSTLRLPDVSVTPGERMRLLVGFYNGDPDDPDAPPSLARRASPTALMHVGETFWRTLPPGD